VQEYKALITVRVSVVKNKNGVCLFEMAEETNGT